jgi:hypothetical protein
MYKIQAKLSHFKFNSSDNHGPIRVTWYKLIDGEELHGVCLNMAETQQVTNYIANNKMNFSEQNYFSCDPDDVPYCSIYSNIPSKSNLPDLLILRRGAKIPVSSGDIFYCMDIELLQPNGAKNDIGSLPFDLIGKIEV